MMWKFFILSAVITLSNANAAEVQKKQTSTVEGTYQVLSIEKKNGYTEVRFEKFPASKDAKAIVLELEVLNQSLFSKGSVLDITAEVMDTGKVFLEAEQVLLNLPRGNGKTRVWLLSRKGKTLNFEKASFLRMHGSENDFLIL